MLGACALVRCYVAATAIIITEFCPICKFARFYGRMDGVKGSDGMKYAVISDVHGNIFALNAVLADARAQGVDRFLLLGDYTNSFPFGNDVADAIRKLDGAVAVRGNGEDYLANLQGTKPQDMTCEQFKPVYWAYQTLSPGNLAYMTALPETAALTDSGVDIYLQHAVWLFYRQPKIPYFWSDEYRKIAADAPLSRELYLSRAKEAILANPEAVAEIRALPKGIHLYGHNHLPFVMEYDGRVFVNPGSCGEPLDLDTRAPYTILTVENGGYNIEERRVLYDLQQVAQGMKSCGYCDYAPAWSKVMELELFSGKDYFMRFVLHLVATGEAMGETGYPVSNEVFDAAVKTWEPV